MIPRGKTWLIDVLDLQVEAWIPEPGEFPTEEEREENRLLWFQLTCVLRYPEPYYADELIEAVLDIHEAVTGRRMTLHGDTHDDYVWERIYHDMEFAAVSCAFRLKEHEWAPLPVLDEIPEINYTPQPIVPEKLTYIGVKLVDQDGEPVERSRVRVKLPDGDIREGRTDRDGELMIKGFALDGIAEIELLDFVEALPEAATADEEEEVPAEEVAAAEELLTEEKEFVVKVVDETGKGVSGVALVFSGAGTSKSVPTDASGVAKWKAAAESVEVTFESAEALANVMKPIWTKCRGLARKEWVQSDDTTTTVTLFGGEVVKAVADMQASGSAPPKEKLEPFLGIEATAAKLGETRAAVATLSVQPLVIVVRMLGEHFDIDKCFLLPKALNSIQELVRLHQMYSVTDLLIVGHADTHGAEEYNLDLSLERTSSMRAYLKDDAETWLKWYDEDKKQSKRWGETEDNYMIQTVLEGTTYPTTVLGYQQWHNAAAPQQGGYATIKEDGKIGSSTRKQLVLDYMHREDTTVPTDVTIKVYGCGEYFPVDSTGEQLDSHAADEQYAEEDRRTEVYLFSRELGMLPPVPGDKAKKASKEYPEWRMRSTEVELVAAPPIENALLRLRLHGEDWQPEDTTSVAGGCDVPYRYTYASVQSPEAMAVNGWAEIVLPPTCSGNLLVEWGQPDKTGKYPCHRELVVECGKGTSRQDVHAQLYNLGYRFEVNADPEYDLAVQQFQMDYSIDDERGLEGSDLPPRTQQRLAEIYASADATPTTTDYSGAPDDEWPSILGPMTPESDEDTSCQS